MYIRQEQPADYDAVYQIIKEAFTNAGHSDGSEQDLVVQLRKSKSFIPELSLVAAQGSRIVGHILFTKAFVMDAEVLALAPLSVLPEYQNKGIGLSLIKQGHMTALRLGYGYSVVLGHSKYYPKAGYVPASRYGIKAPFDVSDECFMAIELNDEARNIQGCYHAACSGTNDDESDWFSTFSSHIFPVCCILILETPVHYRARCNAWRSRARKVISCRHPSCTNDWRF